MKYSRSLISFKSTKTLTERASDLKEIKPSDNIILRLSALHVNFTLILI